MATIHDIATTCGISPATVSKALGNAPDVSAATRSRVRQAAVDLGYAPVASASTNRSWTICVICQDNAGMGLGHYLFAPIIESFKNTVERHGYDIVFLSDRVKKAGLTIYDHCRFRKADGVFIVNTDLLADARALMDSDIPKIAADYFDASTGCVMTDYDKGMDLLYGYLYDLGHRNIVYIHGETNFITAKRIEGLHKAMSARGMALTPECLIESRYYSRQSGYDAMARVLSQHQRPTAVIMSDDYSAVGAIHAAADMGVRVPQDISVIGFDGIEIAELVSPKLTTVRQDTAGIGAKAAENLLKQILGVTRHDVPEIILLEPKLVVGGSCSRAGR